MVMAIGLLFCISCAENEKKFYYNPVIPGALPDPTVIRVGDVYYAAGTSFDFSPVYPIYESRDLVNWKQIGTVFNEPPEWASVNFWAPELFYKDSTFFMYYTAKRKDNRIACIGVATTRDIYEGFTDHGILIEWGNEAIDSYVFQDDDGKLYISWKAYGLTEGKDIEILSSELSGDGLSLIGEPFTLTDHASGWEGAGDEGQCMVKKDGMYYLFYSIGGCCDNRCDYRVMVARSANLTSGWEQYPEPILEGGDKWRCPGHGTLVTTPDKRYFYLYHAYNARDFEFVGRQGLLDEVHWDEMTGWPYFKNEGTPSKVAETPFENTVQRRTTSFTDDFSKKESVFSWEWDVNRPKPDYGISSKEFHITPKHDGITFLGIRPRTGDYKMVAEVLPSPEPAGIGVYSTQDFFLAFMASQTEISLMQTRNGVKELLWEENIPSASSVFLSFQSDSGRYFNFYWSLDGNEWKPLTTLSDQRINGTFIAQWGYSPRTGIVIDGSAKSTYRFSKFNTEYRFRNE